MAERGGKGSPFLDGHWFGWNGHRCGELVRRVHVEKGNRRSPALLLVTEPLSHSQKEAVHFTQTTRWAGSRRGIGAISTTMASVSGWEQGNGSPEGERRKRGSSAPLRLPLRAINDRVLAAGSSLLPPVPRMQNGRATAVVEALLATSGDLLCYLQFRRAKGTCKRKHLFTEDESQPPCALPGQHSKTNPEPGRQ